MKIVLVVNSRYQVELLTSRLALDLRTRSRVDHVTVVGQLRGVK